MYIEGLKQEGILASSDDQQDAPSQPPEFGKPQEMGDHKVDLSKLGHRQVTLKSVNWEPPE